MLKILVKCVSVDHYGFNGRDLHPNDSHIGKTFEVVGLQEGAMSPGGFVEETSDLDHGPDSDRASFLKTRAAARGDGGFQYQVLLCTDGKEWVSFMDFEVEVVDFSKGGAK